MEHQGDIVFLFDVDNTLLDNDRVENDLRLHLEREFGAESKNRYFAILEELRTDSGIRITWALCSVTASKTSAIPGC